jgi:hypothetical protein
MDIRRIAEDGARCLNWKRADTTAGNRDIANRKLEGV